jgi:hypothetical protein
MIKAIPLPVLPEQGSQESGAKRTGYPCGQLHEQLAHRVLTLDDGLDPGEQGDADLVLSEASLLLAFMLTAQVPGILSGHSAELDRHRYPFRP